MAFTAQDERFMRRALVLARRGLGTTSPNPCVGAVLVRGGKIIGEGWHRRAGGPHAEIEALKRRSVGASERKRPQTATLSRSHALTLYVTLEPCSTWGRTPPCTDAIIASGVKRVVIAALDPNPKHDGRGLAVLRRAGIRVEAGLLTTESTQMNAAFNQWITTGRPLVIAKAAMSLDGKIATRTGDSKWITDERARRQAHQLRATVDAIMVGANTVVRDDPRLTLRHGAHGRQPWRVIADARGRCPRKAHLFTDAARHRTIVFTTPQSSPAWRRCLALLGVIVIVLPARSGRVGLRRALRELGRMEVTSVLVEGGGELLGSMFDGRLVDRVAFFYAPVIIGGRGATTVVAGDGVAVVAQAIRLQAKPWVLEANVRR